VYKINVNQNFKPIIYLLHPGEEMAGMAKITGGELSRRGIVWIPAEVAQSAPCSLLAPLSSR